MVHQENYDVDSDKSRFVMNRKSPNSLSIEVSFGKNHIFATTHEDHPQQPFAFQSYLTSTQNIDLGSLLLSLKSLTRRGDQYVNLRKHT